MSARGNNRKNNYSRESYALPEDFPKRLKRFQRESGLSWSEIARHLGTYRHTVWRCASGRTQPNYQHRKALVELADGMGLVHLLTKHGDVGEGKPHNA